MVRKQGIAVSISNQSILVTLFIMNTPTMIRAGAVAAEGTIGYYWTGSFDLNECYIKTDDEIWWQGAISGNKLSNGHFYYNIEDKDVVDEIYTNQGTAWYYGVDIDNERIFLPRNDWFFQNGNDAGKFTEAGLPNIMGGTTGMQGANQQGDDYGAFYQEYLCN